MQACNPDREPRERHASIARPTEWLRRRGICATATKGVADVVCRRKADVGSSPRNAGNVGAGSLRLRACRYLERDVSA